jgi:hypothetical protein
MIVAAAQCGVTIGARSARPLNEVKVAGPEPSRHLIG